MERKGNALHRTRDGRNAGGLGPPVAVDTGGGVDSSLRVVNGNAAVSYYDATNDDRKCAYRVLAVNAARNWERHE